LWKRRRRPDRKGAESSIVARGVRGVYTTRVCMSGKPTVKDQQWHNRMVGIHVLVLKLVGAPTKLFEPFYGRASLVFVLAWWASWSKEDGTLRQFELNICIDRKIENGCSPVYIHDCPRTNSTLASKHELVVRLTTLIIPVFMLSIVYINYCVYTLMLMPVQ
jgi:hypothetical protein